MLGSPTVAIAYLGPVYMEVGVEGGGGAPQLGEVIRLGGVTRLSI